MAKQKKFKKMQFPKALEGARESMLKKIPAVIVIAVFLVLAWMLAAAFFERSDYFKLKSVEARGASEKSLISIRSSILRNYKDTNIFKINLKFIAKGLEPSFPDAKYIVVKRVLPDKILIDLNFRKPFAILTNGQSYPIDREGVILVNRDISRFRDLPSIKGVDVRLAGKFHKKNESKSLESALNLIDEIRKARFLDKYGIRIIDASDEKSLSFYLGEGGPLVIIGYENYKDRLSALRDTLRDPRLVLESINYIDVRFRDVAISPK